MFNFMLASLPLLCAAVCSRDLPVARRVPHIIHHDLWYCGSVTVNCLSNILCTLMPINGQVCDRMFSWSPPRISVPRTKILHSEVGYI
jgi:hypothetical protein